MSASNETVDVGKIVIGFTEPTSVMEMVSRSLYNCTSYNLILSVVCFTFIWSVHHTYITMTAYWTCYTGVYTALFGLYIYLQIHQQGQQHYYQFSLSLLYVLSTTAVVISILIGNQMTLFILDAIFTKDIDSPLTAFHFNSYANLVWMSSTLSNPWYLILISSVAAEGIYVVAKWGLAIITTVNSLSDSPCSFIADALLVSNFKCFSVFNWPCYPGVSLLCHVEFKNVCYFRTDYHFSGQY